MTTPIVQVRGLRKVYKVREGQSGLGATVGLALRADRLEVTVPAQAIAGRMPIETFFGMLAGTLVAVAAASWFWRVGLRNYTGASA